MQCLGSCRRRGIALRLLRRIARGCLWFLLWRRLLGVLRWLCIALRRRH